MKGSGDLDRRIQFHRAPVVDDGFATAPGAFEPHGNTIWASKADASDSERWRAGQVGTSLSARFVVRWSAFTAAIVPTDRLVCEGVTYGIVAIKELEGRRQWIEISAASEQL